MSTEVVETAVVEKPVKKPRSKKPAAKSKKKTKKSTSPNRTWKSGPDHPFWNRTKESGGLLTPRQTEILRLISLGCSTREIALLLQLSPSTVDNHKSAMTKLLGCSKATLLVRVAIEMKITTPEERLTKKEMAVYGDFTDGWNRK